MSSEGTQQGTPVCPGQVYERVGEPNIRARVVRKHGFSVLWEVSGWRDPVVHDSDLADRRFWRLVSDPADETPTPWEPDPEGEQDAHRMRFLSLGWTPTDPVPWVPDPEDVEAVRAAMLAGLPSDGWECALRALHETRGWLTTPEASGLLKSEVAAVERAEKAEEELAAEKRQLAHADARIKRIAAQRDEAIVRAEKVEADVAALINSRNEAEKSEGRMFAERNAADYRARQAESERDEARAEIQRLRDGIENFAGHLMAEAAQIGVQAVRPRWKVARRWFDYYSRELTALLKAGETNG